MDRRVLVAEADTRLRRLYQRLLTRFGYVVAVAGSEAECAAAILVSTPDLLVIDQRCCDRDGTDVLVALRRDTPVVVTVRDGEGVNWSLLTTPDVVDVLYTPAAPSEILGSVRAAFAGERPIGQKIKVTRGDYWAVYSLLPLSAAGPRVAPPVTAAAKPAPVPVAPPRPAARRRRDHPVTSSTGG